MEILANVLKESTIESLLKVADNFLSGNSDRHKVWTNLAWDSRLVLDSGTVICVAVPDNLILEIEESLIDAGLFDPDIYIPLVEPKHVAINIWPKWTYIGPHKDSNHAQAITVYLNKDWSLADGGLFCYTTGEDITCVVPKYNTGARNNNGNLHFTTPVTGSKLRISLQVFVAYKE